MTKREKANARFAAGMLLKQQSFTVMVRDYDYVRSALSFPLGQAGRLSVDAIAPSVYAVKKPRKGSTPDEQPTDETADGPDSAPPPVVGAEAADAATFPALAGMTKPSRA